MLATIALKRKEQEDEAVRQLMKEEAKRKRFKEVLHTYLLYAIHRLDTLYYVPVFASYDRLCWRRRCARDARMELTALMRRKLLLERGDRDQARVGDKLARRVHPPE